MDLFTANPFTVFTLITAPAVLTNASAVMSLTTSNRLARAVDRSQIILLELAKNDPIPEGDRAMKLRRLTAARQRVLRLVQALRAFQLAYGCFGASTLVALIGAVLFLLAPAILGQILIFVSMGFLSLAIGSVCVGSVLLVRETHIAFLTLKDETKHVLSALHLPHQEGD